jgi:hypothetical protein
MVSYNNKGLMQGKQTYLEVKNGELYYDDSAYDGTGNPQAAAAKQIGGTHYNKHIIQPWHIIDEYGLDYYRGNAIKYILRNKMDTREDIEKAIHYLEYWLELNPDE